MKYGSPNSETLVKKGVTYCVDFNGVSNKQMGFDYANGMDSGMKPDLYKAKVSPSDRPAKFRFR